MGNVLAVVLDRKTGYGLASGNYVGYSADLASATDYYPFGMPMPVRNFEATDYRFGQGTQMKSDEVYGDGSLYTAEYWEYDARLGRRWNRDPITYPWQSSYAAFDNSPIVKTDPLGLYGTKSEAEKMQGRAKTAGYQTGEVYENGKEWGFNYTDEKGDNTTTFSQTNFSNGGKRYDGRYMKPVSAYRWRRGNMPEKERDDEAFIKYGEGGNSFSRWWKTVKRDWYAPENSEVTQDIDDVAPAVMAQATVLGMGAPVPPRKYLLVTQKQLQKKFKHAIDFGIDGNYNTANLSRFGTALDNHINDAATQIIKGSYRNADNPVIFYLNPHTGLNVMTTPAGQFISGYKLTPNQVNDVLTKGFLW